MLRMRKNPAFSFLKRNFFTEKRLYKLEQEANLNGKDLAKQRQYLKELFNSGKYGQCISRFESQPQIPQLGFNYSLENRNEDIRRIQSDPVVLETYIASLIMDGKSAKVVEKISPFITSNFTGSPSIPYKSQNLEFPSYYQESEQVLHNARTDLNQWQKEIDRSQPNSTYSSGNQGMPKNDGSPIKVILSEAWSWSKFIRNISGKVVWGILLVTGVSVIMDQQGMLKTGLGSNEVQPVSAKTKVMFEDVQGVDEAKHELEEVVAFLKEPGKFVELGGKLPKGILLFGPPGTGKTHLARAVAGEAEVPFFQMSGSEFDELYVGVGARRVRELFAAAKKRSPCIIFIDELDAVGSKRSMKDQSYMRQTLNQLLVEMDGFSPTSGVVLIAATNTPESLDKALLRPGRFDRLVPVPLPDVKGRTQILGVHMKGVTFSPDIRPEIIARGTIGFSGADLANLVNQAAIKASRENCKAVEMIHMEWAKDKIIMGAERKSAIITPDCKKMTAYHEGGHTLVALFTKGAIPLHKVTIVPRGNALGLTVMLPEADQSSISREELFARIDVSMGGRVAEELIYGADKVSTGASSDLEAATEVARRMVLSYGMSDTVGLISWSQDDFARASPATKAAIEEEIKQMLKLSYERVKKLLKSRDRELHALAAALIDQETLEVEEVKKVIKF